MTSGTDSQRILIVEDETHLAKGLKLNFELEGYDVSLASTAREAADFMLTPTEFSAVVLDVNLPDKTGFELCQTLRKSGIFVPVIMLTVRSSPDDRVKGLEAGADDYLPKPFEFSELLARVRSMIRRTQWDTSGSDAEVETPTRVEFGEVSINFETHEASVSGEPVELTKLELDLIAYFLAHPNRVLSREELLENVWNLRNYPNTRTVDNFIVRLRKYFEPQPSKPVYFISVRGAGYRFVPAKAA
ncbi:MAG: response regulator transcription factor [Myxococcales bacterium]|nr:response regulator transcription factor [Myxococcales bacterium]